MVEIQINNTLTGRKERFTSLKPNDVRIYACGVTVYDDCHIGHAMQAIYFDVIRRYFEFLGNKVTYVRNYTDVDDRIIVRAQKLGISPRKLADDMVNASRRDMAAIGVRPATFEPRVTESIPQIIDMVKTLIEKNFAYVTNEGDVYYRVSAKADYGKLSNRKTDELISGTRDVAQGEKESFQDFALWKSDTTADASWDSPWGKGRPGWHIECSVMSRECLGDSFDIHGGGRDLVFPHHENEIAQSEAANGAPYATYWIHSGLLTINKTKMSKSLGNHISIQEFLKRFPAEALRLSFLTRHYSSYIDFSEGVFKESLQRLSYYYGTLCELEEVAKDALNAAPNNTTTKMVAGHTPESLENRFAVAMADDFNTAAAIADLNATFKTANELMKAKKSPEKAATAKAYLSALHKVCDVLGLLSAEPSRFLEEIKDRLLVDLGITRDSIESLILQRTEAKKAKDFTKSDSIRTELLSKGIEVLDTPTGTRWAVRV
jgi:cysteinyl-tRNA synthetase